MVHTGKNQIARDPPLTAASLLEWCNEEKKISPSKALTRILEQLMKEQPWGSPVRMWNVLGEHQGKSALWGAGSVHRSSKTSCIMGAGKSFPHPEEISSLLQTALHGEKLEQQDAKAFPMTGYLETAACEQEMAFLLAVSIQPTIKIWAFYCNCSAQ